MSEFKLKNLNSTKEIDYEQTNIIQTIEIKGVEFPFSSILIDKKGDTYRGKDSNTLQKSIENSYMYYINSNKPKNILSISEDLKETKKIINNDEYGLNF
jgi:predicted lipase